jgi:protein involved in polysaccharide export with SLBB domain
MNSKKLLSLLVLALFILPFAACSSTKGVSRVQPPGEGSGKARANGGGEQLKGAKGNDKERSQSAVKEIIPPVGLEKSSPEPSFQANSRKDYVRSRFPGKRVIFPEEIKVPEKKPEYRVGIDDVLAILVWNHPDLTVPSVVVRRDGMISLPLIGNLKVEGLTIPEIEEALKKELNRYLTKPQATVNPREMNSQRVFLVGNFKKPTIASGPLLPVFLLKGGNTLLEALSDVEFYPESDLSASYISRGETVIPVNLKALLTGGDLRENVLLEPGDRVVVPSPLKEINVLGEVQSPSRYMVKMETTLVDALSIAKGIKKESADLYAAYVARNKQIIPVNLKRVLDFGDMSQNMFLEDGDIVYVPNSDEKKYFVLGEVFKPGVVYFRDPVDVVEAIAQGGGFQISAQRKQVVVVRGDLRSPQIYEVNMLAMMEGKSFERFPLQKGDIVYIPRTYIADWNVFISQLLPTAATAALVSTIMPK